ncbi:MAG: AAA family ATPase [Candidatus Omnitrophota bacterium]
MGDKRASTEDTADSRRNIIAISGGKGGVGKSVIAANLAVLLALMEKRVVLIDMDFGSANLHTCLGVKSPAWSIKDFLLKKKDTLNEIFIDTRIEQLKFISGAGDMPGLSNMAYSQKLKIIRHLKALEGDHIILDLGPGITFNVLDFFSAADSPVLVTTPETTSITNTFSFIKAFLFRKLYKAFKNNSEVVSLLDLAKDPKNERGIRIFADLESAIGKVDIEQTRKFKSILESCKPKFILNMIRRKDETMGHMLTSLVERCLSVKCECLGCVNYDDFMPESILKMKPFVLEYPESDVTASLWGIASKITGTRPKNDQPACPPSEGKTEERAWREAEELLKAGGESLESKGPTRRWEMHVSSEKPRMKAKSE